MNNSYYSKLEIESKAKNIKNSADIYGLLRQTKREVIIMTTKELLYLEDALGHEKYFQTKCAECAGQIQDQELKAYVEQMGQQHQQLFQSFLNLL